MYYNTNKRTEQLRLHATIACCTLLIILFIVLVINEAINPSDKGGKLPRVTTVETTESEIMTPTPHIQPTSTPTSSPTPTPTSTPTPSPSPTPTSEPTPTPTIRPVESQPEYSEPTRDDVDDSESILTARMGVNYNSNGNRETWYNLPMGGVIQIMRDLGYSEEEYPYWVREDGCKMFGDYIMVAANHDIYPRGSIIHTSLGEAIVCDTGTFIYTYPYGIDIAVDW